MHRRLVPDSRHEGVGRLEDATAFVITYSCGGPKPTLDERNALLSPTETQLPVACDSTQLREKAAK
jgi:hypothetical protein